MAIVYNYRSLCRRIRDMQSWKLRVLSAACAEKVAPIVQALGLKATWLLVEEALSFLWASPLQEAKAGEAMRLVKAVESTPEMDSDGDNSYLPFEVARALDRIRLALISIDSPKPHDEVEKLISLMRDLADSWDASLTLVRGFQSVPVRSILEESELTSQERIVSMLGAARQASSEIIAAVKDEGQSIAALYNRSAPMYCYACLSSR